MRKIIVLFLFGLLSGWAHGATTWYVTTSGSDSNPCTLASPCLTPDHAFNTVAAPGDTVNVAAGVYSYGGVEVHFNTAGTAGNPITLKCATRGACKITNTVTGNSTVIQMTSNYQVIDGFEVTNTSVGGNNLGIYILGHDVQAIHNTVHDIQTDCGSNGGGGIVPSSNNINNVLVDSNLVYNISWVSGAPKCNSTVVQTDGLIAENGSSSGGTVTFSNNVVYNVSGGWGIGTDKGIIPTIVNNTIFNTVNGGVVINNAPSGSSVQDNIIVYTGLHASDGLFYSGDCAIQNGTSSSTTYGHNDLFGNHGGNYGTGFSCSGSGLNTGDIAVDPASGTIFVNWQQNGSGDYHEKAGSATIGAAANVGITHDYDGRARPTSAGYDMGAYQFAQTWYIRADGGTRFSSNVLTGQCNGKFDLPYPGSGVNQNCAFNDFRYMWDDDSGVIGLGAWVMAGGDTVIIRGCNALPTQTNPANPACRIGWDISTGGGVNNNWCNSVGPYGCTNPTIPAGTVSAHTRILGACVLTNTCNTGNVTNRSNLAQLFGGFGLQFMLDFTNTSYVDFEGIELTTHNGACSHHGAPGYPRGCNTSSPLDDYSDNGIHTNNVTSGVTLQDVYIDGFESNGIFGPIGGAITMTRVNISFNMQAGWQFDDGSSTPNAAGSSITASYVTMNGNGCKQEYPLVHSWPALACWDDNSGGFGDAWSGQNTGLASFICDHCVMYGNTKDAFIGPHTQIGTLTITNSFSAANMGAQMKYGQAVSANTLFQNNLIVMNCNRQRETLPGARQNFNLSTGLGGSYLSDYCRAGGDGFSSPTRATSTIHIYGNTFIGANSTMFDFGCGFVDGGGAHPETTCGTSPWIFRDNHMLGYTPPENGGQAPGLWFFDPTFGGSSIVLTADHNNYFGVRNTSPDVCGTNNITCVDPLVMSEPAQVWPGTEAALDVFNPAPAGNSFNPTSGSPLRNAGIPITGLNTDFYGTTRTSPNPGLGGVEFTGGGPPTLVSMTVIPNPGSVLVGSTLAMGCTSTFSDSTTAPCTSPAWTTTGAHTSIGPTSGIVTGVSAGSDTITATIGSISGNATVNVSALPPPKITITGTFTLTGSQGP